MSPQISQTLVSLLLALGNLDISLNKDEKLALNNIAKQLQTTPENEEAIVKTVGNIIKQNSSLAELYHHYEFQVKQLNSDSLRALLLKSSELDAIVPKTSLDDLRERGGKPVQKLAEGKTQEIFNMAYRILGTSDPAATVKQLNERATMQQSPKLVNQ